LGFFYWSIIIIVTKDGEEVPYQGPLAKRGVPQKSDYFLLPTGSSISTKVQLDQYFDISKKGNYIIELNIFFLDYTFDIAEVPRMRDYWNAFEMISKVQRFTRFLNQTTRERDENQVTVKYDGCSTSQQSIIQKAFTSAITIINKATTSLNNGGGANFPTWFGTSKVDPVKKIVTNVKTAVSSSILNYKCNDPQCSPDTYAFVYPTDTNYVIHLCQAFWNSPVCSFPDSQCGTLVHETTHFRTIGGTQDYEYGVTACQKLAKTNPTRAAANADSYEYYNESQ